MESDELKISGPDEFKKYLATHLQAEFHDDDISSLSASPPRYPDFPIFIFLAGIAKDVLDGLTTATILASFLVIMFSLILGLVLFFWLLGKVGMEQKALLRWAVKRFIGVIVIESVPFLAIVPTTTIFIIMAHYRERAIVKIIMRGLEALHGKVSSS